MAALWQLPVIFVIENNQYGMGTSVARAAAGKALHTRGETFGIPGEVVDGMDVFAVLAACRKAAAHCRSGKGPYLLEMDTYRYRGHSMSDPAKYRTRDDVEGVRANRDPISRIATYLTTNFGSTEAELEAVDETIKAEVERIATFATTAPRPGVVELWTDIVPE
jgi:pyruvate dehydrogenase E1 component alpha subunit